MSDTVKLIIEIDAKTYNDIKVGKIYSSLRDVPLESTNAIKNGIPLDDVKAEIEASMYCDKDTRLVKNANASGLEKAIKILDNISKAESEDI